MNDTKSLSQERYSKFAQGYVTSPSHAKGYDLDQLLALAQPQPDWITLDVATGGGHTALKFAPHVKKVIASDITPEMLAEAQKFITEHGAQNVEFRLADAENLPFENEQFDLVTCRIAPHHFPDAMCFVRESARVLKIGGILLVQDHVASENRETAEYADHFERLRDPSHNHAFSEAEWVEMFQKAGLAVEHTEQIIKRHEFLPWAERQGSSQKVITELTRLMQEAPADAASWMQVEHIGTQQASFVNHHLIIMGRKA